MFIGRYNVTGLSKHNFPSLYKTLKKDQKVLLRRDKDNLYDPRATGIWVPCSNGTASQIGWIPKSENAELAARIDKGEKLEAYITRIQIQEDPLWQSIVEITINKVFDTQPVVASGITTLPTTGVGAGLVYGSIASANITSATNVNQPKKESIMTKIVENNKAAATNAAFLEAGRIAVNQATKIVVAQSPLMVRGYLDTPWGKLVVANAVQLALQQFRPNDTKAQKLGNAMTMAAYQEVYQSFDIEAAIESFIDSKTIKAALDNVGND